MKIKALRVFEVGRFCEPVAVDGFSGGIDVLAGPNEMGKSTLFRALRMLLTVKHNSGGGLVRKLTPYGGGQPLIEADLEIGGKFWRITKRFGRGSRAQLNDLDSGTVVARGADADSAFADILGEEAGPAELGLVWVGQKQALETPAPDEPRDLGERSTLTRAIQGELRAITGATSADAVRARVRAQLDDLVTSRGAKRGGRYDAALENKKKLKEQFDAALAGVECVHAAQAELDQLQARFLEVGHPDVLNALEQGAVATADELEKAELSRQALRQARDEAQIRLKDQEAAQEALSRFQADQGRLMDLFARLEEVTRRLPKLRQVAESAASEEESARGDGVRLSDQQNHLQERMRARDLTRKLAECTRALRDAERLDREVAEENERMQTDPVTSERVDRLKLLGQQNQLLEERIAAESPSICVAYEPGSDARVRIDGEVVAEGAQITATQTLVLEVAGVGRIEIIPGGAESRERDLAQQAHLIAERDALLAAVGARTTDDAGSMLEERVQRDRVLASSITELRRVAPDGLVSLRSDVADLDNQLGALNIDESDYGPEDDDLEQRLKEVAAALTRARTSYPDLAQAAKTALGALAEAEARAAAGRQQIAELEDLLGPDDARSTCLVELKTRLGAAKKNAGETLSKITALQQVLPDDDAVRSLQERVENQRRSFEHARAEAARIREGKVALTAQIEALTNSGIGQKLAELTGELQRADDDVDEIEAEVAALQLLREALQAARDTSREQLMAPLVDRANPYLGEVFGEASLYFKEGFAPESLVRDGGHAEMIDRLSDGTQEQLAILVRLAYARLLADRGKPVPLMLDDPLAYSDGGRISQMFRSLSAASVHHQVVVLTCREQAFAALRGTQLGLSPWRIDLDW